MGGCASKPTNFDGEVPESDVSALTVATPTSVYTNPEIVNDSETLTENKKEEEEVNAEVSKEEEEAKAEKEPEIIEVVAERDAPSKKEGEPKDEKKDEDVKAEEKSTETS